MHVLRVTFLFPPAYEKQAFNARENKNAPCGASVFFRGEGGIRTLDTSLSSYNGLANRPFRPLRHLSEAARSTQNVERDPLSVARFAFRLKGMQK
jgi:hypothetical protein